MDTEIQSKKNIGVQIKAKRGNFATLLKLLNVEKDVFDAQNYKSDSRLFPVSAIEELETFYTALTETAPDDSDATIAYDTHNFLLYICSSSPTFAEMVLPITFGEIKTFLATIKKQRKDNDSLPSSQPPDSPSKNTRKKAFWKQIRIIQNKHT